MQYEYKTVVFEIPRKSGIFTLKPATDSLGNIHAELKKLGEDGWQLVGVFPFTNGSSPAQISMALHYFCRPKETAGED